MISVMDVLTFSGLDTGERVSASSGGKLSVGQWLLKCFIHPWTYELYPARQSNLLQTTLSPFDQELS
jgi:hypothetical protein